MARANGGLSGRTRGEMRLEPIALLLLVGLFFLSAKSSARQDFENL